MGRKSKKGGKQKYQNTSGASKKVKSNEWQQDKPNQKPIYITKFNNEMFKIFYKIQFDNCYFKDRKEEFEKFWESLSQPLPISFRINPTQYNYESLIERIKSGSLVKELVIINQDEQQPELKIQSDNLEKILIPVSWYPNQLAWESKLAKKELRRVLQLSQLHSFIQKCNSTGLVTRQELVSMLPPVFLDPQPGEYILDMCAAPGSKTCQLVEMMQFKALQQHKPDLGGGCIVANDVDSKRAYMLTHQLQRLPIGSVIITNHPAQFYPTLIHEGKRIQFDKILCDVPCTGDGAARKLPSRWINWSARDGNVIHPLQLSILIRALSLCKIGGFVLYSTCSLNPVEDEAVIADIFRRAKQGSFELVDMHTLPGFKSRQGLTTWKVLATDDLLYKEFCNYHERKAEQEQRAQKTATGKQFQPDQLFETLSPEDFMREIKNLEDLPSISKVVENQQIKQSARFLQQVKELRPSLFPGDQEFMERIKIEKTMRVLPHDQDTGGFYLALLQKKQHFEWTKPQYTEKVLGPVKYNLQQSNLNKFKQELQQIQQQQVEQVEEGRIIEGEAEGEQELNEIQKIINEIEQVENDEEDEDENDLSEQQDEEKVKQIIQQENVQENQFQTIHKEKKMKGKPEDFKEINEEDWNVVTEYYGIDTQKFLKNQIIGCGQEDDSYIYNQARRFRYISKEVKNLLDHDPNKHLKVLNLGCRIFERGKASFGGEVSPFRICQEGVGYIFPYITKRTIQTSLESFLFIVEKRNLKESDIKDDELSGKIRDLGSGCFVLFFKQGGAVADIVVCQYFKASVSLMCNIEASQNILIRHHRI